MNSYSDFASLLNSIDFAQIKQITNEATDDMVEAALSKGKEEKRLTHIDLASLLSLRATNHIEKMAQLAASIHNKYYGKAITLYQPLYISNYCENHCLYCGFSCKNTIVRRQLTLEEIELEAKAISDNGEIKQILLLTGEAPLKAGFSYIKEAVKILRNYFESISIEVYPMSKEEYGQLKEIGVDGLTVYQETYNRERYGELHLKGRKSDFYWRLETPERGAKAGLRQIGVGALFGLSDCRLDGFAAALHAGFLQDNYLECEISLSLPRIREAAGDFKPQEIMSDTLFVQTLLAFRIFLPRVGINISTRERADFRNNLLGLGVSKLSAGSKTSVGGYYQSVSDNQFMMADNRDVKSVKADLKRMGFQPVHKDWQLFGRP